VSVPQSSRQVVWHQNHDKVYVCAPGDRSVAVIDCTSDTVLKSIGMGNGPWIAYSDSACDKVCVNAGIYLYIVAAATDTFRWVSHMVVRNVGGMIDNGQPGQSNRLYCTDRTDPGGGLYVISVATDTAWHYVQVGTAPTALAWNPVHLWAYVVNSGSNSISVVSDTMLGLEESRPQASSHKPQATIVCGALFLPSSLLTPHCSLLSVDGRKVLDLKPGANDVSRLAPGVYFVRAVSCQPSAVSCSKVVVTR
jgi:DNA-binding beta-propeller fold protein YncE